MEFAAWLLMDGDLDFVSEMLKALKETALFVVTRNSSGDEIANVNFLYNDIVHVL